MITIGALAPSFTLTGTRGKPLRLEDCHGPHGTLLLFFQKGLGSCCGDQSPSRVITEHVSRIRSLGFEPLAIVPDERLTAEEFLTSLSLPYNVAIDAGNEVHAAYDAFFPGTDIPRRTTVIIDSNGRITFSSPGGPGIDTLLNQLSSTPALA